MATDFCFLLFDMENIWIHAGCEEEQKAKYDKDVSRAFIFICFFFCFVFFKKLQQDNLKKEYYSTE